MGCVLSCNPSTALLRAYAPRPLMLSAFSCPGPPSEGPRTMRHSSTMSTCMVTEFITLPLPSRVHQEITPTI